MVITAGSRGLIGSGITGAWSTLADHAPARIAYMERVEKAGVRAEDKPGWWRGEAKLGFRVEGENRGCRVQRGMEGGIKTPIVVGRRRPPKRARTLERALRISPRCNCPCTTAPHSSASHAVKPSLSSMQAISPRKDACRGRRVSGREGERESGGEGDKRKTEAKAGREARPRVRSQPAERYRVYEIGFREARPRIRSQPAERYRV